MQSRRQHVVSDNGEVVKFEAESVAVAFLALALSRTRTWFLDTHKNSYGHFSFDWQFNLGLPSEDFANAAMCQDYLRVAAAAWRLSLQKSPIDLTTAKATLDEVESRARQAAIGVGLFLECEENGSAEVQLVPEVAAEVVGYARSHLREDGLHILFDIGASTLDICSFILHEKQGDDRYELLTADVRELGAIILHRKRVEVVRQAVPEKALHRLEHWDPVEPIPNIIEQNFPTNPDVMGRLHASDLNYSKKCSQMFWQTLIDLKTKRDPRSRRWSDSMPVFVCGGARDMDFYRESLADISKTLRDMYSPCAGLEQLKLSKPANLEADIDDDGYHRLAVAWGLSYPETDIGKVTRPSEIGDIPPRRRAEPERPFVSKDMV